MPQFGPIKRRELIACLRRLGFSGPYAGGKHEFMQRGDVSLSIPNPHGSENWPQTARPRVAPGRHRAEAMEGTLSAMNLPETMAPSRARDSLSWRKACSSCWNRSQSMTSPRSSSRAGSRSGRAARASAMSAFASSARPLFFRANARR